MDERVDIYGRLKTLEEQELVGKWIFNTGPQRVLEFEELTRLLTAAGEYVKPLVSAIDQLEQVVEFPYHATEHSYSRTERLPNGSWGEVDRATSIQLIVATARGPYVWPHRGPADVEDELAGRKLNSVWAPFRNLAHEVMWRQMINLLDREASVGPGSFDIRHFNVLKARMYETSGCRATHLVMNPQDHLDVGWLSGGIASKPERVLLGTSNPSGLILLLDMNCPQGRAIVFDASQFRLGVAETGAQLKTYTEVSERGYELCAQMVTSVSLWCANLGAFQEIRDVGHVGAAVGSAAAAG